MGSVEEREEREREVCMENNVRAFSKLKKQKWKLLRNREKESKGCENEKYIKIDIKSFFLRFYYFLFPCSHITVLFCEIKLITTLQYFFLLVRKLWFCLVVL